VIGATGDAERFARDDRTKRCWRLTERRQHLGAVANRARFLRFFANEKTRTILNVP
jgi:hypothetical protein